METHLQEVRIYETRENRRPYSEWIRELKDARGRAVIRTRINRVRTGNFGNCEPVGEGVLELKINFGPGYRVYFGREGAEIVILTLWRRQGKPGTGYQEGSRVLDRL